ncbi:FixH family protein [Campylobacter concisus]|uniref:FixH family protein n=1 Tax=Campylobacter concisus TaxID=199 RepID=UPI000CD8D714|nr:FixH family protein [Campylobacter concisus]
MAKKSFWPYGIVLSIVAIILACAATIVVAINNPVEMDSAYMQTHQSVDENITFIKESEARFDEKFDLKFEPFKGLQGKFKFLLTPKNGKISSLSYEILLTRPQTNKDNKTLSASWQENELVSESVGLKEGRWQLLLRLNDKQDTRYYKFDFNATK